MLTVYKYQIPVGDYVSLDLPIGAKILCVQTQYDVPCMWVLVDTEVREKQKRTLRIVGTGQHLKESSDKLEYITTFQISSGRMICHVFEVRP